MHPTVPATLSGEAPDLAGRLGLILAALRASVAMRFLRHPLLAPLILPLWTYLNRTSQRFARLVERLAAGPLPAPRAPQPGPAPAARPRVRAERPRLPARVGWLLDALSHDAAVTRTRLDVLLADPAMVELLAAAPTAGRLLRPLCRMLALPLPPALALPRRPRPTQPAAPPPEPDPLPPAEPGRGGDPAPTPGQPRRLHWLPCFLVHPTLSCTAARRA
jgi:hypothetical protein